MTEEEMKLKEIKKALRVKTIPNDKIIFDLLRRKGELTEYEVKKLKEAREESERLYKEYRSYGQSILYI